MRYLYEDLGFLAKGRTVKFFIQGYNLKVMILTDKQYHLFKSGFPYRFWGGYANQKEEYITVPFDSDWVAVLAPHEHLQSNGSGKIEVLPKTDLKAKSALPNESQSDIGTSLDEDDHSYASIKKLVEAYKEFVAFERSTRKLIIEVLAKNVGTEDWWQKSIGTDVKAVAEGRKNDDSGVKWHSARGVELMDYLDFMHLSDIIRSKKNWCYFEPIFKGKWFVENHFEKLKPSRNSLMHAGNLSNNDLKRIELNFHDWYALVNEFKE